MDLGLKDKTALVPDETGLISVRSPSQTFLTNIISTGSIFPSQG